MHSPQPTAQARPTGAYAAHAAHATVTRSTALAAHSCCAYPHASGSPPRQFPVTVILGIWQVRGTRRAMSVRPLCRHRRVKLPHAPKAHTQPARTEVWCMETSSCASRPAPSVDHAGSDDAIHASWRRQPQCECAKGWWRCTVSARAVAGGQIRPHT